MKEIALELQLSVEFRSMKLCEMRNSFLRFLHMNNIIESVNTNLTGICFLIGSENIEMYHVCTEKIL